MRAWLLGCGVVSSIVLGAVLTSCAKAPWRSNQLPVTALRSDPRLAEGQRTFMQHCNQCHVGGGGGVGMSLNDKWMPGFFIKVKVRHGIGSMPKFSDRVINDAQLDDVVHYIGYLHQHPRELRG